MRDFAHDHRMQNEAIRKRQIAFVKACQDVTGLDNTNLARRIGRAPSTLNRFVKPESKNCLSAPVVAALEQLSGLSYSDFDHPQSQAPFWAPSVNIPVVGNVQAGVWTMGLELSQDEWETITIPRPDDTGSKYFGLRVVGDSMDLVYSPGSILICVRMIDFFDELLQGDHVIVQRRCSYSDECEYTVKELQKDKDGKFWLVPRSSNPAHQTSIPVTGGFDKEAPQAGNGDIEIIAVVVADYRRRRR